jgi:hypothetical protein
MTDDKPARDNAGRFATTGPKPQDQRDLDRAAREARARQQTELFGYPLRPRDHDRYLEEQRVQREAEKAARDAESAEFVAAARQRSIDHPELTVPALGPAGAVAAAARRLETNAPQSAHGQRIDKQAVRFSRQLTYGEMRALRR